MTTESSEQKRLMVWMRDNHPDLWEVTYHVKNEQKRQGRAIGHDIGMGIRSGVPDIIIDHPLRGYHGLRIELKRAGGGRVSQAQRKWLERLNARGYRAVVCNGFEEAKGVIDEYVSA